VIHAHRHTRNGNLLIYAIANTVLFTFSCVSNFGKFHSGNTSVVEMKVGLLIVMYFMMLLKFNIDCF